jgi:tetratricopeptide (TPR) repeat protein
MQVDSVLDGSIQQIGERVRVTVRLVRVSDGQPLWSYKCDEACSDVFAVQDAISEKVTQALSLKLTGGERERLNRRYTANAEAYQEYLKGRYFTLQFSPEGYQKARAHLQRAIELDPNYALAYAGLADAHTTASEEMLPPREVMPQAIAAARHALALDDTLAEAHAALGHALFHTWHYAEAEPELRRALELNPNATATYIWYGEFFAHTDPPRGVELLKRAEQLEPLSAIVYGFRAYVALMAGQTELALAEGRKALELAPASIAPWFVQSLVMAGGHDAEAESMLREALAKEREPGGLLLLAIIEARKGRSEEAVQLIEEAKRASGGRYFSPYHFAAAYAALGQKDEAFACLEKAYADQSEYIGTLKYDPLMRGLRGDARLTAMVRRIGLAP